MDESEIKNIVEAGMLAAGRPLDIQQLHKLFKWGERPDKSLIRAALKTLAAEYEGRGIELAEVGSGFRVQVRKEMSVPLQSLWEERAPRYSRALFETLALIAYRQPITRGEIEEVRGVAVSTNIIRTLLEREWVRVVGHRDVPGKPAMFGTTKGFLDYFGLKKLDDLPELSELTDIESLRFQLDLPELEDDGTETGHTGAEVMPLPIAPPAASDEATETDEDVGETGDSETADAEEPETSTA